MRIWEFRPSAGSEREFERAYGPAGVWATLFRKHAGYLGTDLLRNVSTPGQYLTIDRFTSAEAFQAFKLRYADDYDRLDRECEALTAHERAIGDFTVIG
jgi:heme-degrading monooxygenase HmoA